MCTRVLDRPITLRPGLDFYGYRDAGPELNHLGGSAVVIPRIAPLRNGVQAISWQRTLKSACSSLYTHPSDQVHTSAWTSGAWHELRMLELPAKPS